MRAIGSTFVFLVALLATAPLSAGEGELVHVLRFDNYESGPVEDWLQGKGFLFREDNRRPRRDAQT